MVVFTLYHPKTASLLRLWDLSWQRRGWKTRLITSREIQRYGSILKAARGGLFVPPSFINFGQKPTRKKIRISRFPARGWESAPVVEFKREFEVLNCGRHI